MNNLFKQMMLSTIIVLLLFITVYAQSSYPVREDAIWARHLNGATIALDGILNEAAWMQAESLSVAYGVNNGLPTSGWRPEYQPEAITDPTHATVKFLSDGHYLYMGFIIPDSSVGGNADWARWDGILMSIKDRASQSRPTPAVEFFYTWWYVNITSMIVPGAPPRFIGRYGNFNDTTRTIKQKTAWDARTVILGGQSNDAGRDQAWIVEMKICLDSLGYQAYQTNGDVIELNFSIWDCDYLFEGNPLKINSTRSDWQSPWGNANDHNVGRIYIRPDVTINTTVLPEIPPDLILKNGANFPDPVIDGIINEDVWKGAYTFQIKWDDPAVRATYPGVGPYRSGQYQPQLGGVTAPVIDPGECQVKMFFKDNYLYVAADVTDQLVQGVAEEDRFDAVKVMVGDREARDSDNRMVFRMLTATFDLSGNPIAWDYLVPMLDSSNTEFAITLKGSTTVNVNSDVDEGYIVEMKIDLQYLGYPTTLGDGLLFTGVCLFDGDSFDDPLNNYGTRTWWFRENAYKTSTPWAVMDKNMMVKIDEQLTVNLPTSIELLGNYPNPFNSSTSIRYFLPNNGEVEISFFNLLGQEVSKIKVGFKTAGVHELKFKDESLSSGIYFYQLKLTNPTTGHVHISNLNKMVLVK